jgi:hypothetical protein
MSLSYLLKADRLPGIGCDSVVCVGCTCFFSIVFTTFFPRQFPIYLREIKFTWSEPPSPFSATIFVNNSCCIDPERQGVLEVFGTKLSNHKERCPKVSRLG